MGLMLKLNLSPLLGTLLKPLIKALLINILWALLWWLLFVLHLKSQNGAYKFFYILKMY